MASHAIKRLQLNLSFLTLLIVATAGGLPVCRCEARKGLLGAQQILHAKTPLMESDTLNSLISFQLH